MVSMVGDVLLAAGEREQALEHYSESLELRRKLAADDPGNAGWKTDLVVSLYKVSITLMADNKFQMAINNFAEAVGILKTLDAKGKLSVDQQNWISIVEEQQAECIKRSKEE